MTCALINRLPNKINLGKILRGDTWCGLDIGPFSETDAPSLANLVSCWMQFRDVDGTVAYEFNSVPAVGKGTILILNSQTWDVIIEPQELPLETGTYTAEFEALDSAGIIVTPYKFKIKIIEDGTYV